MHFDFIISTFVPGRAQRIQPFFPFIFWSGCVVNLLPSENQFPHYLLFPTFFIFSLF